MRKGGPPEDLERLESKVIPFPRQPIENDDLTWQDVESETDWDGIWQELWEEISGTYAEEMLEEAERLEQEADDVDFSPEFDAMIATLLHREPENLNKNSKGSPTTDSGLLPETAAQQGLPTKGSKRKKGRRRVGPFPRIALVGVLCVLLLGSVVALAAPVVRNMIYQFTFQDEGEFVLLNSLSEGESFYKLTYIPEGFAWMDTAVGEFRTFSSYVNQSGEEIMFSYWDASKSATIFDTEDYTAQEITLFGQDAVYAESLVPSKSSYLVWFNQDMVFMLRANLPQETMIAMAASVVARE